MHPPTVGDLRMLGLLGGRDPAGRKALQRRASVPPGAPAPRGVDLLVGRVQPLVAQPHAHDQPDPRRRLRGQEPLCDRRLSPPWLLLVSRLRVPFDAKNLPIPLGLLAQRWWARPSRFHPSASGPGQVAVTTLTLRWPVPVAPQRRSQSARYISVPRAAAMSPRSTMSVAGQPKLCSTSPTCALAPGSLPTTSTVCPPGTRPGPT